MGVDGSDLTGAEAASRAELERLAAGNLKRVVAGDEDFARTPSLRRLRTFVEIKTVWHPVGT
jgi:hypothetical protein